MRRRRYFYVARLKDFVKFTIFIVSILWSLGVYATDALYEDHSSLDLYSEITGKLKTLRHETEEWLRADREEFPTDHHHPKDKSHLENGGMTNTLNSYVFIHAGYIGRTFNSILKLPQLN